MKRTVFLMLLLALAMTTLGQQRKVQYRPYIDLRPLHFGIQVGFNLQDIELRNVGPQTIGELGERTVLVDCDTWNPGFSVGVLADLRLHQHFSLRVAPLMHFGSKRLTFSDLDDLNEAGLPTVSTQDLKTTYITLPVTLKFAAERFNNHRPYMFGGVSPMINLAGKDQDFIQLKRFDTMLELGMGCDFYLPFFKFCPELKFCFSLVDVLNRSHADELDDVNKRAFALSAGRAVSKMVVLTFNFE